MRCAYNAIANFVLQAKRNVCKNQVSDNWQMTFMSLVPRFYRINDDLILEHSVSGDQEEQSQVKLVKMK